MRLRPATTDDLDAIRALIVASMRGLSDGFYTPAQVESGLRHVYGPDTQLIADGTYFVIEDEGTVVAAAGWSRRATLYGGDQAKAGPDALLDPSRDPARIRAFYVAPTHARRGLGRRLLEHCAAAAGAEGFTTLELMATLPGVPLYAACGFTALEWIDPIQPDGVAIPFVRMRRAVRD